MNVEYINPFVKAAYQVFSTVLNCKLKRGELSLRRENVPAYEISGIIGLSGTAQGMVVLSLGRETALSATELMLGDRPGEINADVVDAIGELANMVAGAAKAQLADYDLSISLPSVVCGRNHSIAFTSNTRPIVIPFESEIGPVCIDVGLEMSAVPAAAV